MALGFLAVGLILPAAERASGIGPTPIYSGSPDTARALLATIAGSLITVLALVFSLTLIAMQLVSTQLTPRALGGFLAERMTQLAAGVFVGTALYAFVVMGYIRSASEGGEPYVPQVAVIAGIFFAVAAMALLLVFVNHVASWMQLANITRRIFDGTSAAIDDQYAAPHDAPLPVSADDGDGARVEVAAPATGFVQYFAIRRDGEVVLPDGVERIELCIRPGQFVDRGDPLLFAWTATEPPRGALTDLVVIGAERDLDQDVDFGLRQLADIALRALSPGINDPTTACVCIHYLQALLSTLGTRRLVPRVADDPRVRLAPLDFEQLIGVAFEEIAHFGASQPRVMRVLDDRLVRLADHLERDGVVERAAQVRAMRELTAASLG